MLAMGNTQSLQVMWLPHRASSNMLPPRFLQAQVFMTYKVQKIFWSIILTPSNQSKIERDSHLSIFKTVKNPYAKWEAHMKT
jgi:hypothetical protein